MISPYARYGYILLRLSAVFAFVYPALDGVPHPDAWVGYFPPFVLSAASALGVSDLVVLHTFAAVEILIALWILSGWRIFWPCIVATAMLLGIVAFNIPQMQILFRDISIAGLTLSLALMNWPKKPALASDGVQV